MTDDVNSWAEEIISSSKTKSTPVQITPVYNGGSTGSGSKATLAVRNNNPGNLRYSAFETSNKDGFSTFNSLEEGFNALKEDVKIKQTGKSKTGIKGNSTLLQFFNVYAPAADRNNPTAYASAVAKRLGVSIDTPIEKIPTEDLAREISRHEDINAFNLLFSGNKKTIASLPSVEQSTTTTAKSNLISSDPNDWASEILQNWKNDPSSKTTPIVSTTVTDSSKPTKMASGVVTDGMKNILRVGKVGNWCGVYASTISTASKVGNTWSEKIATARRYDQNIDPKPGDKIVVPFGVKNNSDAGHVITVLTYDKATDTATTVESNADGRQSAGKGLGVVTIEKRDIGQFRRLYGKNWGIVPGEFKPEIKKALEKEGAFNATSSSPTSNSSRVADDPNAWAEEILGSSSSGNSGTSKKILSPLEERNKQITGAIISGLTEKIKERGGKDGLIRDLINGGVIAIANYAKSRGPAPAELDTPEKLAKYAMENGTQNLQEQVWWANNPNKKAAWELLKTKRPAKDQLFDLPEKDLAELLSKATLKNGVYTLPTADTIMNKNYIFSGLKVTKEEVAKRNSAPLGDYGQTYLSKDPGTGLTAKEVALQINAEKFAKLPKEMQLLVSEIKSFAEDQDLDEMIRKGGVDAALGNLGKTKKKIENVAVGGVVGLEQSVLSTVSAVPQVLRTALELHAEYEKDKTKKLATAAGASEQKLKELDEKLKVLDVLPNLMNNISGDIDEFSASLSKDISWRGEDAYWGSVGGNAIGSIVQSLAGGYALKGIGLVNSSAGLARSGAIISALPTYGEFYKGTREAGYEPWKAALVSIGVSGVSAKLEEVSMKNLLKVKEGKNFFSEMIKNAFLSEMPQELAQQGVENLGAIVTYDKKRNWSDGLVESAIGALIAAPFGAGVDYYANKGVKTSQAEAEKVLMRDYKLDKTTAKKVTETALGNIIGNIDAFRTDVKKKIVEIHENNMELMDKKGASTDADLRDTIKNLQTQQNLNPNVQEYLTKSKVKLVDSYEQSQQVISKVQEDNNTLFEVKTYQYQDGKVAVAFDIDIGSTGASMPLMGEFGSVKEAVDYAANRAERFIANHLENGDETLKKQASKIEDEIYRLKARDNFDVGPKPADTSEEVQNASQPIDPAVDVQGQTQPEARLELPQEDNAPKALNQFSTNDIVKSVYTGKAYKIVQTNSNGSIQLMNIETGRTENWKADGAAQFQEFTGEDSSYEMSDEEMAAYEKEALESIREDVAESKGAAFQDDTGAESPYNTALKLVDEITAAFQTKGAKFYLTGGKNYKGEVRGKTVTIKGEKKFIPTFAKLFLSGDIDTFQQNLKVITDQYANTLFGRKLKVAYDKFATGLLDNPDIYGEVIAPKLENFISERSGTKAERANSNTDQANGRSRVREGAESSESLQPTGNDSGESEIPSGRLGYALYASLDDILDPNIKLEDIIVPQKAINIVDEYVGDLAEAIYEPNFTSPDGQRRLGAFIRGLNGIDNKIILSNPEGFAGVHRTTPYHEIAHLYFREVLNEDQRTQLLNEVKQEYEEFGLDNQEAEERLVQDFAEDVSGQEYKGYKGLIHRMMNFIKRLVDGVRGIYSRARFEADIMKKRRAKGTSTNQDAAYQSEKDLPSVEEIIKDADEGFNSPDSSVSTSDKDSKASALRSQGNPKDSPKQNGEKQRQSLSRLSQQKQQKSPSKSEREAVEYREKTIEKAQINNTRQSPLSTKETPANASQNQTYSQYKTEQNVPQQTSIVNAKEYEVPPEGIPDTKTAKEFKPAKQSRKLSPKMALALFNDAEQFNDLSAWQAKTFTATAPIRAAEKMDGKRFGILKQEFLFPIQDADKNFQIELKQKQKWLDDLFDGMSKDERTAVFHVAEEKMTEIDKPLIAKNPKINEVAKELRNEYDLLIDRINKERVAIGKDKIQKRKNYITHYQELSVIEDILKMVGMNMTEVPNSMLQISMMTKPNSPYFKFAKQRLTDLTDTDAKKAFQSYIEPALKTIHFTQPMKQARDILEYKVEIPSEYEGGLIEKTSLFGMKYPNAYAYWTEYLNALAGKRDIVDKVIPSVVVETSGFISKLFAPGSIGGNMGTVIKQLGSFRNTAAETGIFALKGQFMINTPQGYKFYKKNSRIGLGRQYEPSTKSQRLFGSKTIAKAHEKISEIISIPVGIFDKEMVGGSFLSGYYQAKAMGLSEQDAIRYGDDVAERTQASANIVDSSPINRGKVKKVVGQFQTFVYNEWSQVKTDIATKIIKGENSTQGYDDFGLGKIKEGRSKGFQRLFGGAIATMALSAIYDALDLPNPFKQDEESKLPFIQNDQVNEVFRYLSASIPYLSSIRFGGSPTIKLGYSGVQWLFGSEEEKEKAIKDLKGLGIRLIPAGGQLSKTIDSANAIFFNEGKVTSSSGKTVNFTIDINNKWEVIKALTFGKYQTKAGQNYLKDGKDSLSGLSEEAKKEIQELREDKKEIQEQDKALLEKYTDKAIEADSLSQVEKDLLAEFKESRGGKLTTSDKTKVKGMMDKLRIAKEFGKENSDVDLLSGKNAEEQAIILEELGSKMDAEEFKKYVIKLYKYGIISKAAAAEVI